ncbi:hypothetical protein, partial [Xylella taiwanensis]|uniref:hypothetical protein n=1 Tax=Xylella taiwanensis TaxID=1444770 RepID=UPI001F44B3DD
NKARQLPWSSGVAVSHILSHTCLVSHSGPRRRIGHRVLDIIPPRHMRGECRVDVLSVPGTRCFSGDIIPSGARHKGAW